MINLAVPVDTLPLYNCTQNIKLKTIETFSYIFNDNIDFLTHLYNIGKMHSITSDNIHKTIVRSSIYLGWDYYECPL